MSKTRTKHSKVSKRVEGKVGDGHSHFLALLFGFGYSTPSFEKLVTLGDEGGEILEESAFGSEAAIKNNHFWPDSQLLFGSGLTTSLLH
jgi:hypothetical protein